MRRSTAIPGLAAGAFLVTALLAIPSSATAGEPSVSKLGAPTGVVAIAERNFSTAGDVRVWWHAPESQGGSPVTLYTATASPGSLTCSAGGNSCLLKRLSNGVNYRIRVRAFNKRGAGPYSTASQVQEGPRVSFTSTLYDVYDEQVTVKLNQRSSNTVRVACAFSPGSCTVVSVASAFIFGTFSFEPAVVVFAPGKTSVTLTLKSVSSGRACPEVANLGLAEFPNEEMTLVGSSDAVLGTQYQTTVYDDYGFGSSVAHRPTP
jgi:hypothetical protein